MEWNICITVYDGKKRTSRGRPGFSEKCDIIILIANLNFHKPTLSDELMAHLYQLIDAIEENPESFDIDTDIFHNDEKYDEESPLIKD